MDLVHSGCMLLRHDMDDKLKAANSTCPSEGGSSQLLAILQCTPRVDGDLDCKVDFHKHPQGPVDPPKRQMPDLMINLRGSRFRQNMPDSGAKCTDAIMIISLESGEDMSSGSKGETFPPGGAVAYY